MSCFKVVDGKLIRGDEGININCSDAAVYFTERLFSKNQLINGLITVAKHVAKISDDIKTAFPYWEQDIIGSMFYVIVKNNKFSYITYDNGFFIATCDKLTDVVDTMCRHILKIRVVYNTYSNEADNRPVQPGLYYLVDDGHGINVSDGRINGIRVYKYGDTYYSVNWLKMVLSLKMSIIDFDEFSFVDNLRGLITYNVPTDEGYKGMLRDVQTRIKQYNLKKYIGDFEVARFFGVADMIAN